MSTAVFYLISFAKKEQKLAWYDPFLVKPCWVQVITTREEPHRSDHIYRVKWSAEGDSKPHVLSLGSDVPHRGSSKRCEERKEDTAVFPS